MSNYHPVYTQIWSDHIFTELEPYQQYLFLYLITNKNCKLSGIYQVSLKEIAFSTNLTKDKIKTALQKIPISMLEYDFEKGVVFVKNFFKYNFGKIGNPNTKSETLIKNFELIKHKFWIEFAKKYQDELNVLADKVTKEKIDLNIILNFSLKSVSFQSETTVKSVFLNTNTNNNNNSSSLKNKSSEAEKAQEKMLEDEKKKLAKRSKKFTIPTIQEIKIYCQERNNNVNPEKFYHHYEANGWLVGKNKNPMKSWKSAIITTWEEPKTSQGQSQQQKDYFKNLKNKAHGIKK